MLQLQVPPTATTSKKPSFLQRSTSVASLLAWKERFENYSGKFLKEPSFVSYTSENDIPYKIARERHNAGQYNYGPANDLPPAYPAELSPPPFSPHEGEQKEINFTQDFTALETYLKKKLSVKKKTGCCIADAELETAKVFQWMQELPEGDNLEEFLEVYGIPTKGVDLGDLKERLKGFLDEKLVAENFGGGDSNNHLNSNDQTDSAEPSWKRQIASLEDLAYNDNLEKWIESLDVPYFRPIPETRKEIRKYLNLPEEDAKASPAPSIPSGEEAITVTIPSNNKEMEAFTPQWKELIEKMGALKNEEELDNWLRSLEVPHNLDRAKLHAEIKKFFRHETFEKFAGKSIIFQDHHIAKTLWEKFEDASLLKQVGMIAGTTAVLGLIAVLSATMLSFAVPSVFAINPFFVEVFAQYFLQRQEVAYNLLSFHAQNAKPLSTAWAKQYVLWKYV